MRALIQRVTSASVTTEGEEPQSIEHGYVILLGIGPEDSEQTAEKLWTKIKKLRIFEDDEGKTNRSLADVGGSVLLVSQFTLYADCRKGNRPSFTKSAPADLAEALYNYFGSLVEQEGITLKTGWFGAMMNVELVNNGPFTIWLDTNDL